MEIPSLNKTNGPEAHWSEGFPFDAALYYLLLTLTLTFGISRPMGCAHCPDRTGMTSSGSEDWSK